MQFFRKVVAHGGEVFCLLAARPSPNADRGIVPVVLLPRIGDLWHLVAAHFGQIYLHFTSDLRVVPQQILHVGLPAGEPYFAERDVVDGDRFLVRRDGERQPAARLHRRQIGRKRALACDGMRRVSRKPDGHAGFALRPSPDADGRSPLQRHAALKDLR